jgi:hypothetical protein
MRGSTIMANIQVVAEGTLKPDGSLEVLEKFGLPPGRVRVTIEVLDTAASTREGWFEYLRRMRAERESAGARFRTREEIDAEIDAMRDEWDRP